MVARVIGGQISMNINKITLASALLPINASIVVSYYVVNQTGTIPSFMQH
jgi:hypothetical protein